MIEIYHSASEETLSTETLAHIVSCRHCLDEVNQILSLPSLATRYEAELKDSGPTPPSSAGGGSSDGPTDFSSRFTKRLNEVINHEPKELHISVNSTPVGSLTVSDANELLLNLAEDDPIEFIEIFSQDNVRLLFFTIVDSDGDGAEQWAEIELSDQRILTANLKNVNGEQRLRINYSHALVATDILPVVPDTWSNVLERPRRWLASLTKSGWWLKPEFATAVIVAILIFIGLLMWPTTNGKKILEVATRHEAESLAASLDVIHRTIVLEERDAEGSIVSRRRIESWQDNSAHRRARYVYDQNNLLIEGEWDQPDGSRVIYHHGTGLVHETQNRSGFDEDPWLIDLSATEFKTMLGANDDIHVVESDTNYIIEMKEADTKRMFGSSQLITATLTLNKPSLNVVKLVIQLKQDGRLRELEFTETSSEKIREQDVPPTIFNTEPLRSDVSATPKATSKSARSISPSARLQPPIASAELEVELEHLLYLAKGNRNEQISLTRATDGTLHVEGVVDNANRKAELLTALSAVRSNPLVTINLKTATEAAQTKSHPATERSIIRVTEDTPDLIPMDREVREYFTRVKRLQTDREIDDAVRNFSSALVNRAYRQLFHAIELERLVKRFSEVQIESMTPDARSKWLDLLHDHANALQHESAELISNLELVLPANKEAFKQESAIINYTQLRLAVERIHQMTLLTNDAIGAAFTTSAHGTTAGIKSAEVRRSLVSTNQVAGQLTRYQN